MLTGLLGQAAGLLDYAEGLDIYCTVEIFNDLSQLSVHFFDPLLVGQPTQRPLCDRQHLPNSEMTTAYRNAHV